MVGYMSQGLTEELLRMDDTRWQGDRQEASILFAGIRRFSTLIESMEPVEVVSLLNRYFEAMSEVVIKYNGTLDKYIGDSIMVTFGAIAPLENHPWMSVQTALAMRHQLAEFNKSLIAIQKPIIQMGVGINSDPVITGKFGSSRLNQFTIIGKGVKIATYLEDMSKQYGCDIVIGQNTYQVCSQQIKARELDYISVKEKDEPIVIYEVVGLISDQISEQQHQIFEHYNKGREHYLDRKFRKAMNEFATIVEDLNYPDKPSKIYLKRCQYFLQHPPSEDWNGVWPLA